LVIIFQALDQLDGTVWTNRIANSFDSTQDTETYAAVGMVPQLREWIGAKQAKSFTEQSLRITNKDWESTIRIKNKDRRRDKTGMIQARMGELAQRAVAHNAKLVSAIINTGTATTNAAAYDGVALFSSSHKVGTTTVNNSITVTIANLATGGTGTHGTTTCAVRW
jgi:phage major head subunit gpT-like protein